jgi:kynureninase
VSRKLDSADARRRDEADVLAPFRDRFVVADERLIYLLGNSLGRLPRATGERLRELVDDGWGERLIRGWNDGWIGLPHTIGDQLGPLLGAEPREVLLADSTTVNLYKLAVAALRARPGRRKIITDDLQFPSDLYALRSAIQAAGDGFELQIVPSPDGCVGPEAALAAALDEDTALLALSHTVFKSAYTYDMRVLTARAHEAGALALWDVSHSVGVWPLQFRADDVDLAVGCTYKYLSAGPGAPAILYVRQELQEELDNPVAGWMGQDKPFEFALDYRPATGLRRFLTGTPPILSLAPVAVGVDLVLEAGIERIRAKSVAQTAYLLSLWAEKLQPLGFALLTPREAARRGAHVALGHPESWPIAQALRAEMNVLLDFRQPDTLRLAAAPLYTCYGELYEAVSRLRQVVVERRYERYGRTVAEAAPVT